MNAITRSFWSEKAAAGANLLRHAMRARVASWRKGHDILTGGSRERRAASAAAAAIGAPLSSAMDGSGKPLWTATRIEVAEKMWGEGFVAPGGEEYIKELASPLALSKEKSVLDLSAGLGGSSRAIHRSFKAWVTGLEMDRSLIEKASRYSEVAGLARQAPISHFDPNALSLNRRYDAIFAKEILFLVDDKAKLCGDIRAHLKPYGELSLVDYVADDPQSDEMKSWAAGEPLAPRLLSEAAQTQLLESQGFDVRIVEDMTARQLRLIVHGLAALEKHLAAHSMDDATLRAVFGEVSLWSQRAHALRRGLRLCRYHAIAPG